MPTIVASFFEKPDDKAAAGKWVVHEEDDRPAVRMLVLGVLTRHLPQDGLTGRDFAVFARVNTDRYFSSPNVVWDTYPVSAVETVDSKLRLCHLIDALMCCRLMRIATQDYTRP